MIYDQNKVEILRQRYPEGTQGSALTAWKTIRTRSRQALWER